MHWLIKSEADCFSIDDLKRVKTTSWDGVRNFQARNYMMKGMNVGDLAIFYHANGDPSGAVGVAKVTSAPHPDLSAQNKSDEHYDKRSTKEKPIWYCVDFKFVEKFKRTVSLEEIKRDSILKEMIVARRGNRLSITPVEKSHFERILKILG